jgi:hypothetical protein
MQSGPTEANARALIVKVLDKRGVFSGGARRGPHYRVARDMAKADPALTLHVIDNPPSSRLPVKGPGGRLKGWGGTAPGYKTWELRRASTEKR